VPSEASTQSVELATRTVKDGVRIVLLAKPNSRTECLETFGERLQIRVRTPPTEGKANARIIALLSRRLGIPKSQIEITRGPTAREKEFHIDGLSLLAVRERLQKPR